MNFEFPEEVKAMQEQAAEYLKQRDGIGLARKVLDGETDLARRDWAEMAEMGWTGLSIDESFGGNGIGHLALCALAYEIGRSLTPAPFASTLYLAVEALNLAGSEELKQAWLPGVAAGKFAGCFAQAEGISNGNGYAISTEVKNGQITGVKKPVPDGMCADFCIVQAVENGKEELFLVDLTADGVTREAVPTIEGIREHARIAFDNVPAARLPGGRALVDRLFDRAATLIAFEQVGGAQACLDMAVDYAKQRYAFGRAIGSFQAIKHKLADMFVAIELARSNSYFAAWALSTDAEEIKVAAAAARLSASKAYWLSSKENIQTHGGIGFTWQADCHLYYRRSKALSLLLGSQNQWEERLLEGIEAGLVEI